MFRLRIKEVAEAQGHNMSTLSRKADVPFITVKRAWKNAQYDIKLSNLYRIARALGVRTGDLIEDIPNEEE